MKQSFRYRFWGILICLKCLLLSSVSAFALEPTEKIVLQLHWQHQFEYAGYYAAQHKGYFTEEGLDVQIRELTDAGTSIDMVLSGKAQYAISPSALILDRMHGHPLVLLANDLKSSPLSLLARSEFTELNQLKGYKVMAAPDESLNAEIVYMLKANGIEFAELNWIPHTLKAEDVINGHAAAMTAYQTNQPYELIKQNIPYSLFSPKDYGIDFYGNCLFTSQNEIENNPQRARKVLNASRRGWAYALSNPDEIINYIISTYPVQKSREALQFEASEISKLVTTADCPAGSIDPQKVENIARMFIALGMADTEYDFTGFIAEEANICQTRETKSTPNISLENRLQLSTEEQDYLLNHEPLTTCTVKSWPPYVMVDNMDNTSGMAIDFANILEQRIGKAISPLVTQSMEESIVYAKNRKCDMLLLLDETPEREKYLSFTQPLFDTHYVIVGQSGQGYRGRLEDLSGQTLALFKGHKAVEPIRKMHPEINLLLVDTLPDALRKVHAGEADATLCALASFVSTVSMMGLTNLEVIGGTDFSLDFAVGVRSDEPVLVAIMNKAVASLDQKDINETVNRWLSVRVEKQFDYTMFWAILAVIIIATALLLYRHVLLSRYHSHLQTAHNGMLLEKDRAEKALRAEQEAIQSNLRFVDMISHEYRTPISVISANLETMQIKTEQGNHDLSPNLTKMKQATKKLIEIIETALDRDRLEDGKLTPLRSIFNLNTILTETVQEIQNRHTEREIQYEEVLPKNLQYHGDSALIKIMLHNLIENALKYSPKEESVLFSACLLDKNIILTIKDKGRGIPELELEQIFEKFHRGTNTTDIPGAGVGLHMVNTIVDQHGGQILVSSSCEEGTNISVHLPYSDLTYPPTD